MTDQVSAGRQAAALRWMAEHIEEVGLAHGVLFEAHSAKPTFAEMFAAPCCVIGAAHLYTSHDAAYTALDTLRREVGESVGVWSDSSTRAEVIATLNQVATRLTGGEPL